MIGKPIHTLWCMRLTNFAEALSQTLTGPLGVLLADHLPMTTTGMLLSNDVDDEADRPRQGPQSSSLSLKEPSSTSLTRGFLHVR